LGVRVKSSESWGFRVFFFRVPVLLLYLFFVRLKFNMKLSFSILPFESITFNFYFAVVALFLV
jgi:hypothetical protein